MVTPTAHADQLRVLVYAPTGRDGVLADQMLSRVGISVCSVKTWHELCSELERGAGALLVAQEGLVPECLERLVEVLAAQPSWSDVPLLVFTAPHGDPEPLLERLGSLASVLFIERPARIRTLLSVVRSALRSRQRQYETRDLLSRLSENDRRKNEFLAMLGHELRNPLAAIRAALPVLEQRAAGDVMRPLDIVNRQTLNLTRIVDDLLEVSRVLSGKITLRVRKTDLREVVEAAARSVEDGVSDRAQSLEIELPDEPVFVRADPVRIEQVLVNLLHNAVKYSSAHGHIRLALTRDGPDGLLRVSDDGIGLAREMLDTIFEPFLQIDTSLHRAQGGLGLGLPLVKTLVSLHGGSVRAESAGPGKGAMFTVRLPRLESGDLFEAEAHQESVETPLGRARVLLVDDNHDLIDMLEVLLEAMGHDVQVAMDGHRAVEKAIANPPDIALIDIGLPGLDGYEVARRIRAVLPRGTIRLVAMTGYGQPEDRSASFDAGFDDHLVKPVETAELSRLLSVESPASA